METRFQYADGNGNRYVISDTTIEYIPVKKENSSSGFYSGGDAVTKEITDEELSLVERTLMALIDQRQLHIQDRVMMSGVITHNTECHKEKYIIKPCEDIRKLEGILQRILKA